MYREYFQEKKKIDKIVFSLPVIILIIFLMIASLVGFWKVWRADLAESANLDKIQKKISASKEERTRIVQNIESLNTPGGIEDDAKGRLNMKKNGEEMVVFFDENKAEQNSNAASLQTFWQKIRDFLKI